MGMGGAAIAVGGETDTLFYNPAGLSQIPDEEGMELNVIGVSAELGQDVIDFTDDLSDALDTKDLNGDGDEEDDQLRAVSNVFADYQGDNQHLRIADRMSYGQKFGPLGIGIAGLISFRFDGMTHQGLGSNGILEINSNTLYGGLVGASFDITKDLALGGTVKYLASESLVHNFTIAELINNNEDIDEYIQDELLKRGSGMGIDLGAVYRLHYVPALRPSVGVSIMDIGDTSFGDAGSMPMTVNLGVAVSPDVPVFGALTAGLDYVDILGNNGQDSDIGKRLRFGVELNVLDKWYGGLSLRSGLYQGYPTFGADLRLLAMTVSYVFYAEEIGAYAGQDKDKRQMVMLNIGW